MKMVATDLDSTLLRSDKTISERTRRIMNALSATGIMLVVATARAPRSVRRLLPQLGQTVTICYNGAEIYREEERIYRKYLDARSVKTIVDWLVRRHPGIRLSLEIEDRLYANFDVNEMAKYGWNTEHTRIDFETFELRAAAKIMLDLATLPGGETIFEHLPLPADCYWMVTDRGMLGQIAPKGVSKASAIEFVAGLFGYTMKDVIAFGDDYNDLEMITECGVGVAMGNADETVKAAADLVTATNDEDGVAAVLEEMMAKQGDHKWTRSNCTGIIGTRSV